VRERWCHTHITYHTVIVYIGKVECIVKIMLRDLLLAVVHVQLEEKYCYLFSFNIKRGINLKISYDWGTYNAKEGNKK
jgi:hypothetical protein